MKVTLDNNIHNVIISDHVLETRENDKKSRAFNYNEDDIEIILKNATKNGLTSFRNKGEVVLRFKDDEGFNSFFVLEIIGYTIQIITIFDTRRKNDSFSAFTKIHNRIYLNEYIHEKRYELKIVKVQQPKIKKIKKVQKLQRNQKVTPVTQDEIDEFLSAMR